VKSLSKCRYVLRYFALNYPYKHELSKTRITKMVYIADWFSAQKSQKQITDIKWYFDHYGPYVSDVYDEAVRDRKLTIQHEYSAFGAPKDVIALSKVYNSAQLELDLLNSRETNILDKVIERTKNLNWSEFIDYVYYTYPIRSQKRYSALDLVELAKEEKQKQ
jgi:uncharacterized protein YwgA